MSWSFRFARFAGIDVKVHWTFFLLLLWVAGGYASATGSAAGAAYGVAFLLSVFACVVMHEFGHALAARRYGIETRDVTLLPIGGVARLERMPTEPKQELVVALAGPAVNVVIAVVLLGVILATNNLSLVPDEFASATLGSLLVNVMWTNVILVVFNLIPAFPMDGGRVLRALLATRVSRVRATNTAARVGQAIAIAFGVMGLFGAPMLLLIALFVYLGAEAEARAERVSSALSDIPVAAGMQTQFQVLQPLDTLGDARDQLLAGSQQDFLVDRADGAWGVLHRDDLVKGLQELGPQVPVSEMMRLVPRPFEANEPLTDAVREMREHDLRAAPVLNSGVLVGLLTTENLGELLMLREAAQRYAASASAATSSRDRETVS